MAADAQNVNRDSSSSGGPKLYRNPISLAGMALADAIRDRSRRLSITCKDGRVSSKDCNSCHTLLDQQEGSSQIANAGAVVQASGRYR